MALVRLSLLIICWYLPVSATENDLAGTIEITFVVNSNTGPAKGRDPAVPALVDRAISLLNGKIKPTYITLSHKRAWQMVLDGPNVCTTPRIWTAKRANVAVFIKKPIAIFPPLRLFMQPTLAQELTHFTTLEEIMQKTEIRIGIISNVNYGDGIMSVINRFEQRFYSLNNAVNVEIELVKMLVFGRVDAIFDVVDDDSQDIADFVGLPIIEAGKTLLGYIVCSKSEFGERAVQLLNEAMRTSDFKVAFRKAHLRAFPAHEHVYLETQIKTHFGPH